MNNELFFKDDRLPFVECRTSRSSIRDFKPHLHRRFCVGSVDRGEVLFQVVDERMELKSGSLALVNPETLHSCNSSGTGPKSYSMFYFDIDWCLQVQQSLWQISTFVPVDDILVTDATLYQIYSSCLKLLMDSSVYYLEKEQELYDFMTAVFQKACGQRSEDRTVSGKIGRLKELLATNLKEEVTLNGLAESLGGNPYTFLRQFKKITGITPHAYRTNCRVEQARVYLQQGMDIGETALECGFYDQSHLHRHFKDITAATPREYRVNFVQ